MVGFSYIGARCCSKMSALRKNQSAPQLRFGLLSRPGSCLTASAGVRWRPAGPLREFETARLASNLLNPVNNCTLSTGEKGEFEGKPVASDPNPGGSDCSPIDGFLKRRERQTQVPAECLGYGRPKKALLSTKTWLKVGVGEGWLPKSYGFQPPLHSINH